MHRAKIFLIDDQGKVAKEMLETSYETEEILQRLLVMKPDLLPGDQINPEAPRRWLLVKREIGVPGEAGEGSRWSLTDAAAPTRTRRHQAGRQSRQTGP